VSREVGSTVGSGKNDKWEKWDWEMRVGVKVEFG
jgi:hypothetical protein